MSDRSRIEWTEATWNPVRGCSKVSPGCAHCYAEGIAKRFSGPGGSFEGFADERGWTGRVSVLPDKLDQPLRWRKPRLIFVNSMSDLFHEDLAREQILRVLAYATAASWLRGHTMQILTKRSLLMRELLTEEFWYEVIVKAEYILAWDAKVSRERRAEFREWCKPVPPRLWFGVSVESNLYRHRIDELLASRVAVRFVSYEPALGPLDLMPYMVPRVNSCQHRITPEIATLMRVSARHHFDQRFIDWVIAGGESQQKARPAHPDWFRLIRDQCAFAGVPFFFKQWGAWRPAGQGEEYAMPRGPAHIWPENDAAEVSFLVGKKAAGRMLDGRIHDEFPDGGQS